MIKGSLRFDPTEGSCTKGLLRKNSCVCLEESMSAKVEVVEKNVKTKKRQKGASLVEYALLVALIGVGAVAAMTLLRDRVSSSFSTTGVQMG